MEHTEKGGLGLYLSIPFCRSKCTFCNFASGVYPASALPLYVSRLVEDIRLARAHAGQHGLELSSQVDTIYLGGGTPSILSPADLGLIIAAIRNEFLVPVDAEITLEVAPALLEERLLEAAVELGVNRMSFGVQTFVDGEARVVGRLHSAGQALADLARARRAGIASISVDLIAGLPGQTEASWRQSLATLAEASPDHASIYMLEVDQDSRLGSEMLLGGMRYGAGATPSDDAVADFYAEAVRYLAAFGIAQYEISNFARAGHTSRHNLRYWRRHSYLGLGLDAHSMLRGASRQAVRFGTTDDLEAYVQPADQAAGRSGWGELHWLDAEEELEEAWFLGLRCNAGVHLRTLRQEFGLESVAAYDEILNSLEDDQLILRKADRVTLTDRGRMLSNEVFASFLGASEAQHAEGKNPAMAASSL